ncbi:MAG TPA: hypothetical protein VM282_10710 [Acidimicrobiales bacterium]|nr:hypothetical protein [Acidimicrobiales bacterium]
MTTDADRDPVEWAQHSALVAISVARTVLDLVEAAVADRERVERLATSGRSFAESWLGDAARLATTVVAGFGFEPEAKPEAAPAAAQPASAARERPPTKPAARAAAPRVTKRPATKASTRPRAKPAKAATKKTAKARKALPPRSKQRKK